MTLDPEVRKLISGLGTRLAVQRSVPPSNGHMGIGVKADCRLEDLLW